MKAKWEVKGWNHHPAIRVKKQNNVAERQLENKLSVFEQKRKQQTIKLEQSMRNLKRQLNNMDQERERSWDGKGQSQNANRVPSGYMFRQLTATPDSDKRSRRLALSCDHGAKEKGHTCLHFPCTAPTSYHTIGFRIDPENTSWIPWKELRHSLSDIALSAMGKSAILNMGVSRLRAERRAELLKLEMERRRKRQEKEKPPPWETNYGKPVPYKRLKYPVRLDPLDMQ